MSTIIKNKTGFAIFLSDNDRKNKLCVEPGKTVTFENKKDLAMYSSDLSVFLGGSLEIVTGKSRVDPKSDVVASEKVETPEVETAKVETPEVETGEVETSEVNAPKPKAVEPQPRAKPVKAKFAGKKPVR